MASSVDIAHGNSECSNNGICNRLTGVCKCNTGFDGPACDRCKYYA